MNLYEILGVPTNATQDEIKRAYKKAAIQCHPDKNNGVTTSKFYAISAAYEVLSDPDKKTRYDLFGHNTNMDNETRKEYGYSESFFNIDMSDPKIAQAMNFIAAINNLCSKIFNSDNSIFTNICNEAELDELIAKNNNEMARNNLFKTIKKHFNIELNADESSEETKKYESDFSQMSIENSHPSDIIMDIETNIMEIYKGNIKIITFDRHCFKNKKMIVEERTLKIPICDDRVIIENEGHDYINDDNKLVRGRVIVNIRCLHDKYYKRVNDYDILLLNNITDKEIEQGFNKKFKYFDTPITVKSKNPKKKMENDSLKITIPNKGITYYKDNNIKEPLKGNLIIVLFRKKESTH